MSEGGHTEEKALVLENKYGARLTIMTATGRGIMVSLEPFNGVAIFDRWALLEMLEPFVKSGGEL